ncbi:methylated-DNA--protein-cysteine methyltransferase [Moraxella macacae 0408225]|uniref:Methylated-DNA--protein-cysteine methyltransferase n=1 Tax=Moraxella macacae 0408225 TaxID=1230338 RepID=L2F5X9_9GAMM|nr:methylated-DNA--[protein]-cysteine S-methyltransferase [Moraxella macacae]ELA08437.1 methylated-DNA--protein-cysteine methyltransferase [Moraxella macacae 0408225]
MIATTYIYRTDLPTMTLVVNNGKLIALDWFTQKTKQLLCNLNAQATFFDLDALKNKQTDNLDTSVLLKTVTQLDEYFKGIRTDFDIELDISQGSAFQQMVWRELLKIPYGRTISYAKLAQNIGKPTAFRAVANANGQNPISLIIPCHRVIASDGSLGGYTGGVNIKQILLDLESFSH